MKDSTNILIIGAGPSGLTLATELCRRGIECKIIDKAPGPAPLHESRALAFNARSQQILAPSGVTAKIIAAGHRVDRLRLCWNSNLRGEISMLPADKNHPSDTETDSAANTPAYKQIVIIRQGEIERILLKDLESNGVTVQWNTELTNFSQSDSAVTATVKQQSESSQHLSAAYLVGCDGAHSQVRNQGGYTFDGESDPQIWTLADATVEGVDVAHTIIADFRPGKAFATMAIETNTVRLIHNGLNILHNHPMARYCQKIHWESEFRVSYRLVKQFHRGRSFLCGDAAHIHSPVGGRGMNLGIEDAATLAWLLENEQIDRYTALRLPVAKKVLKMTHQQTSQMNSASFLSTVAKQYGPKLMQLPVIKNALLKSVLGQDTPAPEWL